MDWESNWRTNQYRFGLSGLIALGSDFLPREFLCSPLVGAPYVLTSEFSGNSAFPARLYPRVGDDRISFNWIAGSTQLGNRIFPFGLSVEPDEVP